MTDYIKGYTAAQNAYDREEEDDTPYESAFRRRLRCQDDYDDEPRDYDRAEDSCYR